MKRKEGEEGGRETHTRAMQIAIRSRYSRKFKREILLFSIRCT
jgi:hypothetical protein